MLARLKQHRPPRSIASEQPLRRPHPPTRTFSIDANPTVRNRERFFGAFCVRAPHFRVVAPMFSKKWSQLAATRTQLEDFFRINVVQLRARYRPGNRAWK